MRADLITGSESQLCLQYLHLTRGHPIAQTGIKGSFGNEVGLGKYGSIIDRCDIDRRVANSTQCSTSPLSCGIAVTEGPVHLHTIGRRLVTTLVGNLA